MWERWRKGDSLQQIAKLFDRNHSSVQRILAETGGIPPAPRCRAKRALTLSEREEISRGLVAGFSIRALAAQLGRAPSTVSREVKRNGGRECYRATQADQATWTRARRPKSCKLAENPGLAHIVANKLHSLWSPEQIAQADQHRQCESSGVTRDNLSHPLYSNPRRSEEGVAGVFAADASHAPLSPSHTKDWRSRPNRRCRINQRTTSHGRGSGGTRALGR